MSLTPEQIQDLENNSSRFGCGAEECKACYPLQYACDYCLEQFTTPIENGTPYECQDCGFCVWVEVTK